MEVSGKRDAGYQDVSKKCGTCLRARSISRVAFGYCIDCSEYLCDGCYRVHKDPSPSSNHRLLSGKYMPSEKIPLINICSSHANEKIQYYCKGHSALACQKCVILHHRMCEDVCDISAVSKDPKNLQLYQDIKQKISNLESKSDKIRQGRAGSVYKVRSNKKLVKAAVKEFCETIHEHLHKLEKMMFEEIDQIDEENMKHIDKTRNECDSLMEKLNVVKIELETSKNQDRSEQLFIAIKVAGDVAAKLDDKLTAVSEDKPVQLLSFVPNSHLQGALTDVDKLGHLKVFEDGDASNVSSKNEPIRSLNDVTIEKDGSINIRTKSSKATCSITGSTIIDGGTTLAIADWKNECVKLVDLQQKRVVSETNLPGQPWDITQVHRDLLAATMPNLGRVQFLGLSGTSLSLEREMKVSGSCRGIAHYDDKLFISFESPAQMQILSKSGNVLNTISTQTCRQTNLIWPYHLALSTDHSTLIVSDAVTVTIKCLDLNGNFKSTYKYRMQNGSHGICVAEDGSVIVCDFSNVHVISPAGNSSKVLMGNLLGFKDLESVAYSSTLSTLYVGQTRGDALLVLKLR